MKKNSLNLKKILQFFFLLSLFFIRLPPFYVFYPLKNSFLTSHSMSRYITVALLIYIIVEAISRKKSIIKEKKRGLVTIFIIYFLFQSVSVFGAVDTVAFLQSYKDILFGGIFFFLAIYFRDLIKEIIVVFFITTIGNFFYQMIMFLSPGFFKTIISPFIYSVHFDLIKMNLERGRIYSQTYNEITVPFLIFFMQKEKKIKNKFLYVFLLLAVAMMSFVSNFRTNVGMFFFALLASFYVFFKKQTKLIIGIIILIICSAIIIDKLMSSILGFSYYDRLVLKDQVEDVQTINFREENIHRAREMALARPLFGVGLGNYYEYLPTITKNQGSIFVWKNKEAETAIANPHNILAQTLAETGVVSFFFYIFILTRFLVKDIKKIFKRDKNLITPYQKGIIVAFWTLFIYSFFNPATTLTHNSLFWLLRVLV